MKNLCTLFLSNLLFPLHEKLKKHTTVRDRQELEKSQWLGVDEIKMLQGERLYSLINYSIKNVPYYRRLMTDMKLCAEDFRNPEALIKLPFLDKKIIRKNTAELKAENTKDLSRFNTGGSSGEPLIFFIGKERISRDVAAKWRATRWWDVDIGDKEIVVWGSPIEVGAQDRIKAMRDRVFRTRLLPAFEMSERKLDEFIREICSYHPKMLFGYPSALAHIASHAKKHDIKMNELGIKVAFVTSERLYDHQRQIIQDVFGCPVANGYGGRDAGFIAHECPEGGVHITAEDVIVEIIGLDGIVLPPGKAGEVVVTHLATRDFPFIRYRTGDIAIMDDKQCPCGRGLPLLKEIQGRTTDFIVAKDGTVMHGLALIYVIRDVKGVKNSKIIQESIDKTRIQLVTDDQFQEDSMDFLRTGIKQRLGEDVEVEIERVSEIPLEVSGKFRYVISHVAV